MNQANRQQDVTFQAADLTSDALRLSMLLLQVNDIRLHEVCMLSKAVLRLSATLKTLVAVLETTGQREAAGVVYKSAALNFAAHLVGLVKDIFDEISHRVQQQLEALPRKRPISSTSSINEPTRPFTEVECRFFETCIETFALHFSLLTQIIAFADFLTSESLQWVFFLGHISPLAY